MHISFHVSYAERSTCLQVKIAYFFFASPDQIRTSLALSCATRNTKPPAGQTSTSNGRNENKATRDELTLSLCLIQTTQELDTLTHSAAWVVCMIRDLRSAFFEGLLRSQRRPSMSNAEMMWSTDVAQDVYHFFLLKQLENPFAQVIEMWC